jgi:hypothetical protein
MFGVIGNVGPSLTANNVFYAYASFPAVATNYMDSSSILVAGFDDPEEKCGGNFQTPVAPPGFVCIYPTRTNDIAELDGVALNDVGSKHGFAMKITIDGVTGSAPGAEGSWAYTADPPDVD